MQSYEAVLHQLEQLGVRPGRVFLGEVRALHKILLADEQLEMYMSGRYDAGPAILVGTNRRLILVDKKPFNLTIEDIPYDMISEVQYSVQAFNAYITIHSISKTINMMSFRQSMLRRFAGFVQAKVMYIRSSNQQPITPVTQTLYGRFTSQDQTQEYTQAPTPQATVQQYYSKS